MRLLGFLFVIGLLVPFQQMASLAIDKPLPKIVEKAFIAKFQVTIVDKNYHLFAIEKSDDTQQKSSFTTIKGDKGSMLILDYKDRMVTDVTYTASTKKISDCGLFTMKTALNTPSMHVADNFHILGGWRKPGTNGIPHMFSSKDMFSLNMTKLFKYQGTKSVDSIEADHWSANMAWKDDQDKFQVDYYFTSEPWVASESHGAAKFFPLRIEITGTKTVNGKAKNIHHYYDYLEFITSDRLDSSAFDLPSETRCMEGKDTTQPRTPPQIPDNISYRREIVDSKGNVDFSDVAYDKNMGLMQIISGSKQVLYDFHFGVRYESKWGSCTPRAIDPDKDFNSAYDNDFVKDVGPVEFAVLKNTTLMYYIGQGHRRQIGAYSFGSIVDAKSYGVSFGKSNWNFSPKYKSPPLSLDLDGKHYNIFDFSEATRGLRVSYLWGSCRLRSNTQNYKITFHAPHVYSDQDLFTDENVAKISDAIAKQSWLSYSQVQIIIRASYFSEDSHTVVVLVQFFSPPASHYMYRHHRNVVIDPKDLTLVTQTETLAQADEAKIIAKSADVCEHRAASTAFRCRSYDLCKNADGSYTMKMFTNLKQGVSIKQSSTCDHFARSVDGNAGISLDAAYKTLQDAVTKGLLTVSIGSEYEWQDNKLVAIAIEPQFGGTKQDPSALMYKFTPLFPLDIDLVNTEITTAKTTRDCEKMCYEKGIYRCKAYRACYESNRCVLSAEFPYKNTSYTSPRSCIVRKRTFTSEFQKMPGVTMAYASKTAIKNVADANECAAKCVGSKNCESFDFCKDSRECLLSKTHIYSVTADKISGVAKSCSHYSKNYLLDFDISKNTGLSSDDKHSLQTIVVSHPEQCAYLCRNVYGSGCVQFDICYSKLECQIATKQVKGYVAHVPKQNCDTFTLTGVQRAMASGKLTGSKETTYSDGSFGGLAFAMILVGLALGAGILFVLHKRGLLSRFIG